MYLKPSVVSTKILTAPNSYGGVFLFLEITCKNINSIGRTGLRISVEGLKSDGTLVALPNLTRTYNINSGKTQVFTLDITVYQKYTMLKLTIVDTVYSAGDSKVTTIAEAFESTRVVKYSPATFLQKDISSVYLKAVCNLPTVDMQNIYMFWERSTDGVHWDELNLDTQKSSALQSTTVYIPQDVPEGDLLYHDGRKAYLVHPNSVLDTLDKRADVISIVDSSGALSKIAYRATMCTVEKDHIYPSGSSTSTTQFLNVIKTILGRVEYTPVFDSKTEIVYTDISQASNSKSLRYSGTLYGFGNSDFKNYVIPTYAGESVRPLSKLITLNTYENTVVTSVIPWRDYLIAFTENSTHLIVLENDGSYTKTVNSDIGVPLADYRCCKAILNGVIFKSGSRIYFMYPNMYSGTDTVTNLTDISEAVSDYIIEYADDSEVTPFAITSDEFYMLFMPKADSTVCLKYEYNDKRWTLHEYPIVFYNYETFSHGDVRVFGYFTDDSGTRVYAEYSINSDVKHLFDDVSENLPYVDFVTESSAGIAADIANWGNVAYTGKFQPIHFVIDSGQKTDSKWYTKQFSESKFVVSTLHQKDTFPMKVIVHIDGAPHISVTDVNTDSSFWKNTVSDIGTLSTNLYPADTDIFNTYRKMFIRYSGKGTSIRHIIEGESIYPFKIYDVIYRFKVLNVKK
jgi:hypothetical protein